MVDEPDIDDTEWEPSRRRATSYLTMASVALFFVGIVWWGIYRMTWVG